MTKEFRVYRENLRQGSLFTIIRIDGSNSIRIRYMMYSNDEIEVIQDFFFDYDYIHKYVNLYERIC